MKEPVLKKFESHHWPTCPVAYVQKSDFHLINVFCIVIVVKKCIMATPSSLLVLYFVPHRSKMPLLLKTKVTHLRILLFRQSNGANSVVRRVSLAIAAKLVPKQSSAVSGLWILTVASTWALAYIW